MAMSNDPELIKKRVNVFVAWAPITRLNSGIEPVNEKIDKEGEPYDSSYLFKKANTLIGGYNYVDTRYTAVRCSFQMSSCLQTEFRAYGEGKGVEDFDKSLIGMQISHAYNLGTTLRFANQLV